MTYKNKFHIGLLALSIGLPVGVDAQVAYFQQNIINSAGFDSSTFLGGQNAARTTNAEVGDINRDGFPDILDGNSTNFNNFSNVLIRMNPGDGGDFIIQEVGPADNFISYDVDLVDVNNDGYDDLIRTEVFTDFFDEQTPSLSQVSVYLNLRGSPWFSLSSRAYTSFTEACPLDIDVADVNNDGFLDFAIAQTTVFPCVSESATGSANIYLNNGDGTFNTSIPELVAELNVSSHDVVFLDANHDQLEDLVVVNENGASVLYLNDGGDVPNFVATDLTLPAGLTGNAVDINTDGFVDFVIGGADSISVFLNNSVAPGTFTAFVELLNISNGDVYDVELADLDADGDIDILTANYFFGNPMMYRNEGGLTPVFTDVIDPFDVPFHPESLSVEVIDYDLDGDNDIYIAGGEFTTFLGCFGCSVNQFYETEVLPQQVYTNFELDTGVWFQSSEDTNDWRFRWDRTSSLETGPDRASAGTFYYYLETTVGGAFEAGNTAILESPTLPLGDNRYVVFDYHMYGLDIGSLHVDVFDGTQWIESVWSVSGQQQLDETNPWLTARVDLSEFAGEIKVRIRAVAAGGFRGDIAIDNLNVTNEPFTELESIDTTFIVEFPLSAFVLDGDLIARVGDEEFPFCDLSAIEEDGERCEITLSTAPNASVELFVDLGFVFADENVFLNVRWFGCDEEIDDLICRFDANGATRSAEFFQSFETRN